MSCPLSNAKVILENFTRRYSSIFRQAKIDIRPAQNYNQVGGGHSYVYYGIDKLDEAIIYEKIGSLAAEITSSSSALNFDIENYFITARSAIDSLVRLHKIIYNDVEELRSIKQKYLNTKHANYPIEECLKYHEITLNIINEVLLLPEVVEILEPSKNDILKQENDELRFKIFWQKRRMHYILHLVFFIIYLLFVVLILIYKEDKEIKGISHMALIVISGVVTILFNLLFNNHNSFKNSWKLIIPATRKKLIMKEKMEFLRLK